MLFKILLTFLQNETPKMFSQQDIHKIVRDPSLKPTTKTQSSHKNLT